MRCSRILTAVALLLLQLGASAQQWAPKQAPLMTRFAKDVDPNNVLPEYPRPQMAREKWLNLNGLWQFQPGTGTNEAYPQGPLARTILVPFAVESALSGVMEHHERLWYRRHFVLPADWKGERVLLHFGAVDYECEVFINDKSVGRHQGGYDPFSFDITDALKAGEQTITVQVYDPTSAGGFPRGKQSLHPGGIMYTSVSGIWQTVWLEPVPQTRIEQFKITPDIDQSVVKLNVFAQGRKARDCEFTAEVLDGTKVVATVKGKPLYEVAIPIKDQKLWSPESPFLYDLKITLTENGRPSDTVKGYFGMRKISVETQGEFKRLCLNNKFVFQLGPLDQGWWPDGLYTAPTDAALKYDLEMTKAFGFNMTRKHIKVEPYRWYYWADKLGLMVWQDMPSPNSYTRRVPPVEKVAFRNELVRMVETHWNQPCIVMWVVFNEGQGQHDTKEHCALVKGLDPTRLVNQCSGTMREGFGDVIDHHSYPPPSCGRSKSYQAIVCGEYGGIGYIVPDHTWKTGPTYVMVDNTEKYMKLYDDFATMLTGFKASQGLNAAVYTEITDVEVELNGLMTYDRLVKGDINRFRASNRKAIEKNLYIKDILPTSKDTPRVWQYTTTQPEANWMQPGFDASAWKSSPAGFGTASTPGAVVKTEWNTHDIWLRQDFNLGDLSLIDINDVVLSLHHDDDCEVYINGVEAAKIPRFTSDYATFEIAAPARQALKQNGKNSIAIHCHQAAGGQFIDCGLALRRYDTPVTDELLEKVKGN